jgi:DNA-binding transcriptional LysR family regulator
MNDRLSPLKLFVRAARVGNFSSAGRELGLSQPSASLLIAALEEEAGATLFSRTTRAVTPTEGGATYLMRVEAILAALDDADQEARGTGEVRGSLRVGTSSSFVLREIIPQLPAFMKQHPALKIELVANDRYQDLVTEGIDVAFRFGALPDSSATARKIIHLPRILMASPDYLRERGTPTMPSDLAHHSVIIGPAHPSPTFTFRKDGRVTSVRVGGRQGRARFRPALEGLRRTACRRGGLRHRSRGLQRRSELDVDHAGPVRRGARRDDRVRRHQRRLLAAWRPVRTDPGPRPPRRALTPLSEAPESVSARPNQ